MTESQELTSRVTERVRVKRHKRSNTVRVHFFPIERQLKRGKNKLLHYLKRTVDRIRFKCDDATKQRFPYSARYNTVA